MRPGFRMLVLAQG